MRAARRVAVPGEKRYENSDGGRRGSDRLGPVDVAGHRCVLEMNRDEAPGRRRADRDECGWFEWMVCSAGRTVNAAGALEGRKQRFWELRRAARRPHPRRMRAVSRLPAGRP